jgi:hypothetical protein
LLALAWLAFAATALGGLARRVALLRLAVGVALLARVALRLLLLALTRLALAGLVATLVRSFLGHLYSSESYESYR